jgi:hypothetical protein
MRLRDVNRRLGRYFPAAAADADPGSNATAAHTSPPRRGNRKKAAAKAGDGAGGEPGHSC